MNGVATVVVGLNNGALAHFLNGDFDKAIEMLRSAYDAFDRSRREVSFLASCHQAQSNTTVANMAENARCNQPSDSSKEKLVYDHMSFQDNQVRSPSPDSSLTPRMRIMNYESDSLVLQRKSKHGHLLGTSHSSPCSLESSPSTAHSMYNRALVLSSDQNDFSLLVVHHHRTEAIILYNLALVYHNIGIHLGLSSALPYALGLYELALKSIDQDSNILEVQKLLMAILNNLGNIYTHLFCMEETERCLEKLRIVLAVSIFGMTADEDYNFFFLNAVFQGKELCFAPAA